MVSIEVDGVSIGLNAVLIISICTFGSLFCTDSVGNQKIAVWCLSLKEFRRGYVLKYICIEQICTLRELLQNLY